MTGEAHRAVDWDDLFLAAVLEPDRWPDALDGLARQTGGAAAS